jgi:hypothetical protein
MKTQTTKSPYTTTPCTTQNYNLLQALPPHARKTHTPIDNPELKKEAHYSLTKGIDREAEKLPEGTPRLITHPSQKPRHPTFSRVQAPQKHTQAAIQDISDHAHRESAIRALRKRERERES